MMDRDESRREREPGREDARNRHCAESQTADLKKDVIYEKRCNRTNAKTTMMTIKKKANRPKGKSRRCGRLSLTVRKGICGECASLFARLFGKDSNERKREYIDYIAAENVKLFVNEM